MLWWEINVMPEMINPRIVGRFEAAGGTGNDIHFSVTDDDGLRNYQNNQSAKVAYWRKATVDTFNFTVPHKRQYVVFSNRFSTISAKSIAAQIYLEYDLRQ